MTEPILTLDDDNTHYTSFYSYRAQWSGVLGGANTEHSINPQQFIHTLQRLQVQVTTAEQSRVLAGPGEVC